MRWVVFWGVLAVTGIVATTTWTCIAYRQRVLDAAAERLQTVLDLKVQRINAWRAERLADAAVLSESNVLGRSIDAALNGVSPEDVRLLREVLESTRKRRDYEDIYVVSPEGDVQYSLSGHQTSISDEALAELAAARADGQPKLTDLYFARDGHSVRIDTVVPIVSEAKLISHMVVLASDARRCLYPLLGTWPMASKSAETLLVRRADDDVLFLNELRFQAGTALKLRIPLSRRDVPAVRAVLGESGVARGKDYRNEQVMSAFTAVPNSAWFAVAKEDLSEILIPWRRNSFLIVLIVLTLAVVISPLLLMIRQREVRLHHESLDRVEDQLYQREVMLRTITDTSLNAILMMDDHARISYYNPAAEHMFGWSQAEALGKDLHDLLAAPAFRAAAREAVGRFRDSGQGSVVGKAVELLALHKDGYEFPVEIALSSVKVEGTWHAVGIVKNITERKRAEAKSALEVERTLSLIKLYELTQRTANEIIETVVEDAIRLTGSQIGYLATLNDDESAMTMRYWSKSAHETCGVVDKPIVYPLVTTGLWGEAVRQRRPVITNDYAAENPLKRGLPEGHVSIIRHMNIPVFEREHIVAVAGVGNKGVDYDDGDVRQLQLLMQGWWQIMTRQNAEERLRASEEKFRRIVENIGLGVVLLGADMEILEVNRKIVQWFPLLEKLPGPVYYESLLRYACDGAHGAGGVEGVFQDGCVHEGTNLFQVEGAQRTLKSIASPIHDREGRVVAAIETLEDVSEKIVLERELAQSQKLESIGRLAAGIAHEINTPTQYVGDNIEFLQIVYENLLGIVNRIPSLLDAIGECSIEADVIEESRQAVANANLDYLSEQVPRAIEQSLEGVNRIASIVQAMKEFSHPGVVEKTSADLNQCIRGTVTVSRNEWKYVAELELELDESLPLVTCLPGDLNQALLNMIVNAAHAIRDVVGDDAEKKGKITITTRRDDGFVVIGIADTGAGIPEAIRSRIFDPFFTTKAVGHGTGQGLAIARNVIVDKHGGTIVVESEPGKGTTFTIRLPIGEL